MSAPKPKFVMTQDEITQGFELYTHRLHFECTLSRELVGGLPATREGIEAFAQYQMEILSEEEKNSAVARIMTDELGLKPGEEVNITPPEGELDEKLVGQVNVLRTHPDHGPWVGDWMVKAALKQTASRIGIWVLRRGSKGDMSEGARVFATGNSALEKDFHPERIYLRNSENDGPAKIFWQTFRGRIQSPNGPTSIVTHAMCVEPGARFEFDYLFLGDKMEDEDIRKIVYFLGNTGLGSSRAMERGKIIINRVEYMMPEKSLRPKAEQPKAVRGKKKGQPQTDAEASEPRVAAEAA